ncbi:acetyl-CoA carboxylase biotin carboxyl carrier protein [Paenibacillus segetis]|uniref:Biotin carboxyl carrier protein of acetyl-CoA carboxylase n=1 Tax=Paenibacillus segetis TaxID=1325360 RepID=A0ABQ1YHX9_9BACL|nr:acetyl-CoA carboxylase biotin carboxyl carrier protein [Paenibacillus segetis]GGH25161.1 acetyl-CoA carboxylase, biotin carboxyl carrier protein [Paenibacillus segetis]
MFKLDEIKELIELMDKTTLHELEIENEGSRLCIRRSKNDGVFVQPPVIAGVPQIGVPTYVPTEPTNQGQSVESTVPSPREQEANLHTIVSPMVGTFYRSSSPDANPYVNIGDKVGVKTTVCIIEAMKLMNELEAEVKGEIIDVLVENGQLVEYGQPLFLVKPE